MSLSRESYLAKYPFKENESYNDIVVRFNFKQPSLRRYSTKLVNVILY
jgi:hypothetical protein